MLRSIELKSIPTWIARDNPHTAARYVYCEPGFRSLAVRFATLCTVGLRHLLVATVYSVLTAVYSSFNSVLYYVLVICSSRIRVSVKFDCFEWTFFFLLPLFTTTISIACYCSMHVSCIPYSEKYSLGKIFGLESVFFRGFIFVVCPEHVIIVTYYPGGVLSV